MPLRRFQPISRSGQWSETVSWTDPRTRQLNSLDGAVLTMALYQGRRRGFRDYGFIDSRGNCPIVSAQTQADGSGPFFILPDLLHAQWIFPAGSVPCLPPGDAHLCVWATVDGATDQIIDEVVAVLDGPAMVPVALPMPIAIGGSPGGGGAGGANPGTPAVSRYDLSTFATGQPGASEILLDFASPIPFTLPANLSGSVALASTAPTAPATFALTKDGTQVAAITFAVGANTATFAAASAISVAVDDRLQLIAPASQDATLAGLTFTIVGNR